MSELDPDAQRNLLAQRANGAIDAIRTSLTGHGDADLIETNARSLRSLADLIADLHSRVSTPAPVAAPVGCGDPDCLGRPVDGIKTWVPMNHLHAVHEAAAEAAACVERYREGLRTIASRPLDHAPEVAMLCDWEAVARALQRFAADLLDPPPTDSQPVPQDIPHRQAA